MKCFKHSNNDAICICYSCNQGLCHECRVPAGPVYACKDSCEDRAKSIASLLDINIKADKNFNAGELKDENLLLYKQNKTSSAIWLALTGSFTFYFIIKFISSFSKPQTDDAYLWFSFISGAFLFSSISSFNKWRTLCVQREKVAIMVKSR